MRSRVLAAAVLVGASVTVSAPAPAAGPCDAPTIRGTGDDDTLRGTSGPDVIDGRGGDDTIRGLGGDDVLCGGSGRDTLVGGDGADRLYGQTDAKVAEDTDYYVYYGDTLDGGPGSDLLDGGLDPREPTPHDALTFLGLPEGATVDLAAGTATSGADIDTVVGSMARVDGTAHDDVLLGSDADESLHGDRGSDIVDGRGGDDWVDGADAFHEFQDTSPNTVSGGPGNDTVNGDAGADLLHGDQGDDLIQADGGRDTSYGDGGDDSFNDEVGPGPGQVLDGGPGRDAFNGVSLSDRRGKYRGGAVGRIDMTGGRLTATMGRLTWSVAMPSFEDVSTPAGELWTVLGTDGPETIYAGFFGYPVKVYARGGRDRVFGSDQDDVINGGAGRDTGTGWAGRDRVVSVERIIG